jgi:hypothetical protein
MESSVSLGLIMVFCILSGISICVVNIPHVGQRFNLTIHVTPYICRYKFLPTYSPCGAVCCLDYSLFYVYFQISVCAKLNPYAGQRGVWSIHGILYILTM